MDDENLVEAFAQEMVPGYRKVVFIKREILKRMERGKGINFR